jgi:hypothetical protein
MDYSLSGKDLLEGSNNKAKIITYPDLYKYKDIDELLDPHGAIFLLYEFEPRYGHWTLLFRQGDTIEHFDSYNYSPDSQFNFIPDYFRKVNKMIYPKLTEMMYKSNYDIHFNNYKMQAEGQNISTCGRHCLVRLMLKDLNIDEYYKLMKKISKELNISYDDIVLSLTSDFK